MKGTHLGEFEELVLLVTGVLSDEAYAVKIAEEIHTHTNRTVSLSPVHSALYRLEKKGFVKSELGGASKVRGGRRKRIYTMTSAGRKMLDRIQFIRNNLWNLLPAIS